MTDLTTIGEVLIDLTQTGTNQQGVPLFAANPGGAPANVAVAAARLGARTAFLGKIGRDGFGDYLKSVLQENQVDVAGLRTDEGATTLAVVTVSPPGSAPSALCGAPTAICPPTRWTCASWRGAKCSISARSA